MTMPKFEPLYIIFDGPPDHNAPHFVEVETAEGLSVNAGEWKQRGDYWTLGPFCERLTEAYAAGKQDALAELLILGRTDSHGNVVWFGKNPHAFPSGTEFYAAAPKGEE